MNKKKKLKMKRYEFLEHTADAKFIAYGKDLEEAFENAAIAVVKLMTSDTIKPKIKKEIKVKGKDMKQLLHDFLEELLFLLGSENFIFGKADKMKIDKDKLTLEAVVLGDDIKNYKTFEEVKGITYNSMEIRKEKNKYALQLVVDV